MTIKKESKMLICRHCGCENNIFLSLGHLPPANIFLDAGERVKELPINVFFCTKCSLMQLEDVEKAENLFNDDFKYFSSYSKSLINHSLEYCQMIIKRLSLKQSDRIIEIASNDGYLLKIFQNFNYKNLLGVEPSGSVAREAIGKGIPTEVCFFNDQTANEIMAKGKAKLIVANNVIAHVPNINSFVSGIEMLLEKEGSATIEFQYLRDMLEKNAFDMIYHEHFSYLSLSAMDNIMKKYNLLIYDAERLKTQGGSLRVYIAKKNSKYIRACSVNKLLAEELEMGIDKPAIYELFAQKIKNKKKLALDFVKGLKKDGKTIACYGAAAKGSTFLNYLGINSEIVDYVVDKNTEKQGLYMAGCNLKVFPVDHLAFTQPDYILILPWNIKDEIIAENIFVRNWGGKFLVMMPSIEII